MHSPEPAAPTAGSGGSHGSSHSSSSGGTSGGSHDSNSTSGSTSSGTVSGGSSSNNKAERDIKIDNCKMDAASKKMVARLTVTNSGSVDYTYNITMKFRGATSTADLAQANVTALKVKAGASQQAEATTAYTGKGDGSEFKECVVGSATKSAL